MLHEISQRKTNTIWHHLYVYSENKIVSKTRSRFTGAENKLLVTSGGEGLYKGGGERSAKY